MSLRVKFSYHRPRPQSQSGQALLEYILIMVVSVSLVLALMMQVFQPMQKFLSSYMGDYTACLLETGELPSLGSEVTAAADEGCAAKFESASFTHGRPAKVNPSSPGSGGSGKSDGSGSEAGSTYAGSASRGNTGGQFFRAPRSTQGGDGASAANKVTEIPVGDANNNGFFKTRSVDQSRGSFSKSRAIAISGLSETERKKLEKKENLATRVIANEGLGKPQKKTAVKPPPIETPAMAEEVPFTIGNFMRMLFIIAIILAVVVFVGGQVLQMSKSYEK